MSRFADVEVVLTVSEEEFFSLNELPLCDRIEIRLDLFSPSKIKIDLTEQIRRLDARCIFTYRQAGDTDQIASSSEKDIDFKTLAETLDPERHYLDLELNRTNDLLEPFSERGFGLVRSVHKFDGILNRTEIENWITNDSFFNGSKKYFGTFPLVYKFAVFPQTVSETADFLFSIGQIANKFKRYNILLTGICMGPMGIVSRIFPERFGSYFTYCCLAEPKAPGQVDIKSWNRLRSAVSN
ncbi:type I 3-dehydroquinate dehydratase [Leptospira gomenensis]|uniref:3-dehydroquinate dehydratase n=1 Tax=Leptospira gomenensis TaxID=2484974 RepID=A0A5F1Y5T8_9LEPT|nr:type I 3-dehydroquinate dehydratase [Leptospira gomenensis]TGK28038.1 type I 3-dehydroquinate dehydratase [Leptospira gomenensis]TGK37106.1 type I 3-dehydroquinate dehydratase [Leptospira gomenensis]TGK45743.1 type I 3-dehydroquinate dehydratase [Leptospira gomenensis]TGK59682.1 type I 3-dehydroquinate dehydratase [Leptospira gomenensis]